MRLLTPIRASLCALAAMSAVPADAATYRFIAPYAAAGTSTSVLGINNAGYMTGAISSTLDNSGPGFIRSPGGVYTTFTDSGAFATTGRAINSANTITGYSTDSTLNLRTDGEFVRTSGGSVTPLTDGVNPLHGIAQGINTAGSIVGDYFFTSGGHTFRHGYSIVGGVFTDISVDNVFSHHTQARGITDSGLIVGWATLGGGVTEGFIYSGGAFNFIIDPSPSNATTTYLEGINNNGLAVGEWQDISGNFHAFEYNLLTSSFLEFAPPGASNAQAFGLNDLGQVVITGNSGNWLYDPNGVPEPASWALMLLGFGGVGAGLRRLRRTARSLA